MQVSYHSLLQLLFWSHNHRCRRARYGVVFGSKDTRFPNPFHDTNHPANAASVGVTRLLPVVPPPVPGQPQNGGVLVGNKRGTLGLYQKLENNKEARLTALFNDDTTINGSTTKRPSPIFGLDVARDGTAQVFSGAGDCYVSVWEKENDDSDDWYCRQKLGPHTGWVRSILYDEQTNQLHSIGCNCIETWHRKQDDDPRNWQHWKTSRIASSPTDGSTVSSDLLCLCQIVGTPYLLAGGVDGRLHVFDSKTMGTASFSSTPAAHNGRVNAMAFSEKSGLLFTTGNDGKLKHWKCHVQDEQLELVGEYIVGNETRVTCVWTQDFGGTDDHIFCGTSNGQVFLLTLPKRSPKLKLVTTFQLTQRPIIHSICIHKESVGRDIILWIGHSNGLSIFTLDDLASLKTLSSRAK